VKDNRLTSKEREDLSKLIDETNDKSD
jgi:hypothetical protein